jgi:hypothetical protein
MMMEGSPSKKEKAPKKFDVPAFKKNVIMPFDPS